MRTLLLFTICLFNIQIAFSQDTLYWKDGNITLCKLKRLNLRYNTVEATDFEKKTSYNIPLKNLLGAGGFDKNKGLAEAINTRIADLIIAPPKRRKGRN